MQITKYICIPPYQPSDGHHPLAARGAEPHICLLQLLHHLQLCQWPQRPEASRAYSHHYSLCAPLLVRTQYILYKIYFELVCGARLLPVSGPGDNFLVSFVCSKY